MEVPNVIFSVEIITMSPILSGGRSNLFTASDLLTTNRIPSILDSFEVISLASTSDGKYAVAKDPSAP